MCSARVIHKNGCKNITGAKYVFYKTSLETKSDCTKDDTNCYTGSCKLQNNCSEENDISMDVNCFVDINYIADSTDDYSEEKETNWSCEIIPYDNNGNGVPATDTIEISSLMATETTQNINYGIITKGKSTEYNNRITTTNNTGNTTINLNVHGTNMECSKGNIKSNYQKYDTKNFSYKSLEYNLTQQNNFVPISLEKNKKANIYWGIKIPDTEISGYCYGTNTLTPIISSNH